MADPLLIADVPWLLYRSFFGLPKSIVDGEGRPVNALLGTVNAILSVLDARLPARPVRGVVACMGDDAADYRVELYPAYHAHRDAMPVELAAQWEKAPQLLDSLGWNVSARDGLEADDVMFSFALAEQQRGGEALLLTGDRDLYGAVSERVAVIDLRKGEIAPIGPTQVRARYGVDPRQVPDFIALRGDPSDGLPGAPGIGAKTAAELLRTHGTLEAMLAAADNAEDSASEATMRPRTAASLRENAELLHVFKRIATLQRFDVQPPEDRVTDFATGARVAGEMGMRRLAERLAEKA